MNLKQLKKELVKDMSLWEKIRWHYWSTPLSLFWWQDTIEHWKIYRKNNQTPKKGA